MRATNTAIIACAASPAVTRQRVAMSEYDTSGSSAGRSSGPSSSSGGSSNSSAPSITWREYQARSFASRTSAKDPVQVINHDKRRYGGDEPTPSYKGKYTRTTSTSSHQRQRQEDTSSRNSPDERSTIQPSSDDGDRSPREHTDHVVALPEDHKETPHTRSTQYHKEEPRLEDAPRHKNNESEMPIGDTTSKYPVILSPTSTKALETHGAQKEDDPRSRRDRLYDLVSAHNDPLTSIRALSREMSLAPLIARRKLIGEFTQYLFHAPGFRDFLKIGLDEMKVQSMEQYCQRLLERLAWELHAEANNPVELAAVGFIYGQARTTSRRLMLAVVLDRARDFKQMGYRLDAALLYVRSYGVRARLWSELEGMVPFFDPERSNQYVGVFPSLKLWREFVSESMALHYFRKRLGILVFADWPIPQYVHWEVWGFLPTDNIQHLYAQGNGNGDRLQISYLHNAVVTLLRPIYHFSPRRAISIIPSMLLAITRPRLQAGYKRITWTCVSQTDSSTKEGMNCSSRCHRDAGRPCLPTFKKPIRVEPGFMSWRLDKQLKQRGPPATASIMPLKPRVGRQAQVLKAVKAVAQCHLRRHLHVPLRPARLQLRIPAFPTRLKRPRLESEISFSFFASTGLDMSS